MNILDCRDLMIGRSITVPKSILQLREHKDDDAEYTHFPPHPET
ncbi:hypothetical protein [Marinobacterium zhoushanense]|nr:hypothetical protein [Marinobacterium zhoushanense]